MIQTELNIMNIMYTVFGNQTDGQEEKNEICIFLVFDFFLKQETVKVEINTRWS